MKLCFDNVGGELYSCKRGGLGEELLLLAVMCRLFLFFSEADLDSDSSETLFH